MSSPPVDPGLDLDLRPVLAGYVLALGDDALVLAQRCAEWLTRAPELEEDVALANIALDLLGQARLLLAYAGELEGRGRSEDDLAYLREEREFRNLQLCELGNGDFAVTMARLLLLSSYFLELYRALSGSADARLAAIAAKAVKEAAYHRDHARSWVLRLGDGTPESSQRMQAGLDTVWPYLAELFDDTGVPAELSEIAVPPSALAAPVTGYVTAVITEATLQVPAVPPVPGGGRRGVHTEAMGPLLAELQFLARCHPGASW